MEQNKYRLGNDWKVSRIFVGRENTPVLIIDDFLEDLSQIRTYAQEAVEMQSTTDNYYPGIRATLPREYSMAVVSAIYRQLYKVYDIPKDFQMQAVNCVFSLISLRPEQLAANQRRPHFDTPNPHHFAILHYLNDGDYGATGFFRHKQSGLEKVPPNKMEKYLISANNASNHKGYIKASNEEYELIEHIPYKPNRLVIYPGNLLHSVLVNEDTDIDTSPVSGRLTANIFIEYV